ncbi:nucleotidyltransferase domain-containing protein [Patescibacteria group bacterium]|nr:nucleotidyltransferase domain-containing protein [Patescibacteria group bacterium]
MGKQELKSKIRTAIEEGPLKESIEKISLFGSYAKDSAKVDSDVDLLVEFSPDAVIGFFSLIDLKEHIEKAVGKPIDLLTPDAISKYLKKDIMSQSDLIYER